MTITIKSNITGETKVVEPKLNEKALERRAAYFGKSREGSHKKDRD